MGKSTISMAIFNCYVSSPEGITSHNWGDPAPCIHIATYCHIVSWADCRDEVWSTVIHSGPWSSFPRAFAMCLPPAWPSQHWNTMPQWWPGAIVIEGVIAHRPASWIMRLCSMQHWGLHNRNRDKMTMHIIYIYRVISPIYLEALYI